MSDQIHESVLYRGGLIQRMSRGDNGLYEQYFRAFYKDKRHTCFTFVGAKHKILHWVGREKQ